MIAYRRPILSSLSFVGSTASPTLLEKHRVGFKASDVAPFIVLRLQFLLMIKEISLGSNANALNLKILIFGAWARVAAPLIRHKTHISLF